MADTLVALTKAVVQTSRNGKSCKSSSREGWADVKGQVYLPPVSGKRTGKWFADMMGKEYSFVGGAK